MKMKFLLLLSLMFTSLSVFSQKAENKSNPYGIWTGLNVKPQDADYIRGRFIWRKWCDLEAERGKWTWEVVEARIKQAVDAGKYVGLVFYAGPDSPAWIYDNGVPKVVCPDKVNVRGGSHKSRFPHFPYYLDSNYRRFWFDYIRATAEWVDNLPNKYREKFCLYRQLKVLPMMKARIKESLTKRSTDFVMNMEMVSFGSI